MDGHSLESQGHKKSATTLGGWGRCMQTKMSRTTKRNLDRKVDKRRRRKYRKEDSEPLFL